MVGRNVAWLLAGTLLVAMPALAQPAQPAQPSQASGKALAVGHEALDLYNKGSWAEARAKFAEAEALAHSPVFVLYLARCARNAGDLAGSKQAYERLAAETLPAGAPPPWVGAVDSAKKELEELKKRMADLAAAAPTSTATAAATTTAAPTGTLAPAPTGTLAPAPTGTLAPAPTGTLAPTATARPTATALSGPGPVPTTTAVPTTPARPGPLAPGLAAAALGVVALGVGTGLFVHAKSIADDVLQRCDGPRCAPEDEPLRSTAIGFGQAATGAFIGGGIAAGAGVLLLLLRPGGTAASPSPAPATGKVTVRVDPGVASLRVSGSF